MHVSSMRDFTTTNLRCLITMSRSVLCDLLCLRHVWGLLVIMMMIKIRVMMREMIKMMMMREMVKVMMMMVCRHNYMKNIRP